MDQATRRVVIRASSITVHLLPSGAATPALSFSVCNVRARTGGKLRSSAVTHGHREQLPIWA